MKAVGSCNEELLFVHFTRMCSHSRAFKNPMNSDPLLPEQKEESKVVIEVLLDFLKQRCSKQARQRPSPARLPHSRSCETPNSIHLRIG